MPYYEKSQNRRRLKGKKLLVGEAKMNKEAINGLVTDLSLLKEVKAITLGGSRSTGRADLTSDYDLYIYINNDVPLNQRQRITEKYCQYMELGNTYYELEEDGQLKDGTVIEMIYRNINDFESQLKIHMEDYIAYGGYSTCLIGNLQESIILYDEKNQIAKWKAVYKTYPMPLRANILSKNRALLSGKIPSLDTQILKASERGDLVSVNHRITEFLASYFDVIFAINYVYHPGEKRMLEIAQEACSVLPKNMARDTTLHLKSVGKPVNTLKVLITNILHELDYVLEKQTDIEQYF